LRRHLGQLQQINHGELQSVQEPVGHLRREAARSFENVMHVRLGNARPARQAALRHQPVPNQAPQRLDQASLKQLEVHPGVQWVFPLEIERANFLKSHFGGSFSARRVLWWSGR